MPVRVDAVGVSSSPAGSRRSSPSRKSSPPPRRQTLSGGAAPRSLNYIARARSRASTRRLIAVVLAAVAGLCWYFGRDSLPMLPVSTRTSTHKAEAQVRAECLEVVGRQKSLLFQTFSGLLKDVRQVALIGFPNHGNKGDSAIWYAEEVLLANLGIKIVYQCDSFWDFDMDALKVASKLPYFAIMFHGGGNFGDIYMDYPALRLKILKALPEIPTIYFPQSISYSNPDNARELAEAYREHSSVTLHVRDEDSFSFATTHFTYPNVKISLVPDIVFYLGSLHDLRLSFGTSQRDLLFFKRTDSESTSKWTEDMGGFVKRLGEGSTPPRDLSWSQGDWVDFDTASSVLDTSFSDLAWQRFMLGSSWLSKYEFVVLDRLHGHILCLLLGIPHLMIDNSIGKLSHYHKTWTSGCKLGKLVVPTEVNVQKAYLTFPDYE